MSLVSVCSDPLSLSKLNGQAVHKAVHPINTQMLL